MVVKAGLAAAAASTHAKSQPSLQAVLQTRCAELLTEALTCPATPRLPQLTFLGAFVGAGIFGLLCDRWGRRMPLFLSTALVAASMLASLKAACG